MSSEANFLAEDEKDNSPGRRENSNNTKAANREGSDSSGTVSSSAAIKALEDGDVPNSQKAIDRDKEIRLAMAATDTPNVPALDIVTNDYKSLEKNNRFKNLFDLDKAHVYTATIGKDGKEILTAREPLKPGEKLEPGDYVIKFQKKDGEPGTEREFAVHIPKREAAHADQPMPLLMNFHGVMPVGLDPLEYARNMDLAKEADRAETPFIVVNPRAALNSIDGVESYFWVADNTPVPLKDIESNAKRLGYKDNEFIAALPEWLKEHTNADSNNFGMGGHSLGGMLAAEMIREMGGFPFFFSLNSSRMTNKDGSFDNRSIVPGNAEYSLFFHPRDRVILPDEDESMGRNLNGALQSGLKVFEAIKQKAAKKNPAGIPADGIAAKLASMKKDPGLTMDNVNQRPLANIRDHREKAVGPDEDLDIVCYLPSDKNKSAELKRLAHFDQVVFSIENFRPDAFGGSEHIWTAESRSNGKKAVVVQTQGGHAPDGERGLRQINHAGMIADTFSDFVKRRRQAWSLEDLANR